MTSSLIRCIWLVPNPFWSSPEGVDNRATDRGLNVRPPITSLTFDSARTDDDVLVYKAAFQPPKREMSLCIGSFQDKEQAQHLRHRFDGHDARIVRAVVDGQLWHRRSFIAAKRGIDCYVRLRAL